MSKTQKDPLPILPVVAADLTGLIHTLTRMQVRVRALAELRDGPLVLQLAEDFGSHVAALEFIHATHRQLRNLGESLLTHHWARPLPEEKTILGGAK
jgi:hypothetical protein